MLHLTAGLLQSRLVKLLRDLWSVERGLCLGTGIEGGKEGWRGALGGCGAVQRDLSSSWHTWNSAGVSFGRCGMNSTSPEGT